MEIGLNKKLVSVIIPTYNRKERLIKCINSVLTQNYENIEIIIIDDHSSDGTVEQVKKIKDSRIILITNEDNYGSNVSRNIGLKKASGDFIAFLDDDDVWYRNKLITQVEFLDKSEYGMVYSGYDIYIDNKLFKSVIPAHHDQLDRVILGNNIIGSPTPLIKKEILNLIGGYDESLTHCQDWELWIRVAHATKIYCINEILARYNIHGDQKSSNVIGLLNSREYIFNKYFNFMSFKIKAIHLLSLSKLYAINGDRENTKKYLIQSMKYHITPSAIILYILFKLNNGLLIKYLQKFAFINYDNKIIYG